MGLMSFPATIVQADRDSEIVAQAGSLRHCFQVVEGCVRVFWLLENGRRQITDFLFAGDLLGLDAIPDNALGAEAVTPVTLRRIPQAVVETRASTDLRFARELRAYGAAQIRAAHARCVLLGRKTASERVAAFLLEMAQRLGGYGKSGMYLPMSRTDIADYLGLTTETVCRTLTDLRQRGAIRIERARITILDLPALERTGAEYVH